ncbi:MAG TPA: molybdenum cofactor biosynthesis protein MoaE [Nocardioidaceae bacterium]|nr:molybdenum cofactor biosynthesis protein MoaE [Nocardioidaceae bacterium]
MSDLIRLLSVSDAALDLGQVYAAVDDPAAGGIAVFVGTVRQVDGGKRVTRLDYTAHPSAEAVLSSVADDIVAKYDVIALAAVHRVGSLEIGDVAVITAVSCAHRGDAFDACRALIDDLKLRLPVWKHQIFADGTEEWVGTP